MSQTLDLPVNFLLHALFLSVHFCFRFSINEMSFQSAIANEKLLKPPCLGLLAVQLRCCREDCFYKVCEDIPKRNFESFPFSSFLSSRSAYISLYHY